MSSKERRNLSSIMELEDLPESNHGCPIDGSCSILKPVEENPIVTYTPIPLLLSFSNLTYSIRISQKPGRNPNTLSPVPEPAEAAGKFWKKKTKTKTLLDDISGEARDGEILAILGASGSGKSTLIDALAGRMSSLKGSVKLNGEALESRLLRVISAYVMQDDLLLPMLTVEETLMFSAEFRLPRALSRSKKRARVQALIDQLGLRSAANTIIGDESHRGVSGGERRRVSIGIDIIHDPIILFLDEPTSGLDSTSAYMVVKVLQLIAQRGSVVVMSIHQPSSRILSLLDSLIILSRGRTVYTGPPSSLPLFFSEFGHPIPENENRTEFALDLIRELEERSSVGAEDLVEFHRSWRRRRLPQNSDPDFGDFSLNDAISTSISRGKLVLGAATGGDTRKIPEFANPFWVETVVLARRSYINSRRMPEQFAVRLGAMLVTGFIFATIFWRVDYSPRGVTERVGFFALAVSTTFYMCAESLPVLVQNRYIFMRETAYNSYRLFSYLLANALVSIPSQVFLSLAFSAETFWAVGLAGGMRGFLFYFFAMVASFWAGSSFVTFLSAFVSHVTLGYTVVIASLAQFVLLSGVFINRDRIPVYWVWLHYASLVKYPFQAVLDNEFGDTRRCFATGSQMFDSTPLGNLPESMKERLVKALGMSVGLNVTGATCIERGTNILKREGVTDLSKWNCMWVLVGWGFLFRILFYLCLLLSSKNKRR